MKKNIKIIYRFFVFLLLQFGLDISRPLNFLKGLPRYINGIIKFKKLYKGKIELLPCLHDWYEEGGQTKGEYFLQDLYIARKINEANPTRHLDIGSSVQGFVAHVASFRDIEVLDVREITSEIPGIIFRQSDLSLPINEIYREKYDSVSCLHALEHFGLGRYGDPIDPEGHKKGLRNMYDLLSENGLLYLSVPIGIERVEFNANRVFNPDTIMKECISLGFELNNFILIQDSKVSELYLEENLITQLSKQRYALGMFLFRKISK